MPELPEVETLKRQLATVVAGRRIEKFTVLDPKLGDAADLAGQRILSVGRKGKYLFFALEEGLFLTLHLRMTGRLLWQTGSATLRPHTRFTLSFAEGRLDGIDPRRFATLVLGGEPPPETCALDPLSTYPPQALEERARGRSLPVKSFLLDQRVLAGIGNIYACEILHAAVIDPRRRADSLAREEWRRVAASARAILARAIADRGTTMSDWRDLHGEPGAYQHVRRVYRREGEACSRCGSSVARLPLQGRGTYFCPACQK
jgi:formamidopyrimidine-DNA glycosylase